MHAIAACPNVFSIDRDMVAKYHGYDDVWHYYADMSVGRVRADGGSSSAAHPERRKLVSKMGEISRPMLVVS